MRPRENIVIESVQDLIGQTDLLRLRALESLGSAAVWAKLEQQNPSGSVGDRVAFAMLEDGERRGLLRPGAVVVEATSGDSGVALALACALKQYALVLTMPESTSLEARKMIAALGARIVLTSHESGMEGAVREAGAIADRTEGAFAPLQFDNSVSVAAHATTAHEIVEAMGADAIDAVVLGVETSATLTGIARAFRQTAIAAHIIAVEPEASAFLSRNENGRSRIQGMGAGFRPKNYDASLVSEVRTVRDEDAWKTKTALAQKTGLLVGISSGAVAFVALEIARELGRNAHVVTLFPSTGERAFSLDKFFSNE